MEKKNIAPVSATQKLSTAEELWNEIKNKDISMFSLPIQKVSDYCAPVYIEPSRLFLVSKASSFLPSLEAILGNKYNLEAADKYIIITRK